MARTKEFDPDTALQAALELFWERGYEATSMADLVDRLGVARASIYATFGSKHDLYVRALGQYLRTQDPSPVVLLSRPGPALPAVRELLQAYAHEVIADVHRRGCMLVNAACERLPGDAAVARRVESGWDGLEVALASALTRAQAQGELPGDADPSALASFLLVFLQGVRVLGHGSPNPDRIRAATTQALAVLGPLESA